MRHEPEAAATRCSLYAPISEARLDPSRETVIIACACHASYSSVPLGPLRAHKCRGLHEYSATFHRHNLTHAQAAQATKTKRPVLHAFSVQDAKQRADSWKAIIRM